MRRFPDWYRRCCAISTRTATSREIAERIVQLGGAPDFNPEGLATRSHAEYREGENLTE